MGFIGQWLNVNVNSLIARGHYLCVDVEFEMILQVRCTYLMVPNNVVVY
jgi:hypothetical protein